MKKPLLIVKNITREGPGLLEIILKERTLPYTIVDLSLKQTLPAPELFSAVIVLGGPDSANDETTKMQIERTFVKNVVDQQIPYLGICLGLQVMVKVAGGAVEPSPVKEIGLTDAAGQGFTVTTLMQPNGPDPIFAQLPKTFPVFQLHGESVKLTVGMELLGVGQLVKNQIVRIGQNAYGTQFHLELTTDMLNQWMAEDPDLQRLDKKTLEDQFLAIKKTYTAIGRQLFENFLRLAGTI